ncbi:MAG: hypothetical protein AB1553_07490 [Nitrospirota bacterium]
MTAKISFHFNIEPEWEAAIREGKKNIDVRENAESYADVRKGDTIRYRSLEVIVKHIRAYPGLVDLIHHEDYRRIVPGAKSADEVLKKLLSIGLHEEPPHGVLAFEVEPIIK